MNREEIIRMAREAGIPETEIEGVFRANSDDLGRLLAAEREECAKICDELADEAAKDQFFHAIDAAENCSAAIRARGQS